MRGRFFLPLLIMNNLPLIALVFVSMLLTSCATDVKEPVTNKYQEAFESLPIDYTSDEEFFGSDVTFPEEQ